jgi:hypothetical protein
MQDCDAINNSRTLSDTLEGKLRHLIETTTAHICQKDGQPIRMMKQCFGFQSSRLRGLTRKRGKVNVLATLNNLFMAKRLLVAAAHDVIFPTNTSIKTEIPNK